MLTLYLYFLFQVISTFKFINTSAFVTYVVKDIFLLLLSPYYFFESLVCHQGMKIVLLLFHLISFLSLLLFETWSLSLGCWRFTAIVE